jgi:hypothetical protein
MLPSTAKLPIPLPCAKVSARMRRAVQVRCSFVSARRACP